MTFIQLMSKVINVLAPEQLKIKEGKMNVLELPVLSLFKKINLWREKILVRAFKNIFAWYERSHPESYRRFAAAWLRPRLVNLSNLISFSRAVLLLPLAVLIVDHQRFGFWPAFMLCLVISLSDFIDCPIAKAAACQTTHGPTHDPLADKLFVAVVFLATYFFYQPALWLWLIVAVLAGEFIYSALRLVKLIFKIEPYGSNFLGRSKFFIQVVVVYLILFPKTPVWLLGLTNHLLLLSTAFLYSNIVQEAFYIKSKLPKTAPLINKAR